MRTMYDSVNYSAIPTDAQMVAGYISPSGYMWPAAAWSRFPSAIHVQITPSASENAGHVLDVEKGDATPAQAPGWVQMRRASGADPTVYCAASQWGSVQAAFTAAGVAQPHYWIASYPGGGQVLPTLNGITAVAHQYADPSTSGGDYDLSVVADYWPGVDQGGNVTLDAQDHAAIQQDIMNVLASNTWRFDGRNVIDMLRQAVNTGFAVQAAVGATDTDVKAAQTEVDGRIATVIATLGGLSAGAVDVNALAGALVPLLSAQEGAALVAALKTQFDKA